MSFTRRLQRNPSVRTAQAMVNIAAVLIGSVGVLTNSYGVDLSDPIGCNILLHPQKQNSLTPNLTLKRILYRSAPLTDEETQILAGFFKGLRKEQIGAYTEAAGLRMITEITDLSRKNPQNFDRLLFKPETNLSSRIQSITKLYGIALDRGTSVAVRASELSRWASSEDRARFVYELLMDVAYPKERKLVLAFMQENRFFQEAVVLESDPAILITTSFEKETFSFAIVKYYKEVKFTDHEWKQFSESEQYQRIQQNARSGDLAKLVKRDDSPSFISPLLKDEGVASRSDRHILEITKNEYALTPLATKTQMRKVASDMGETHSFHAHVVTEVPAHDPLEFAQFKVWHEEADRKLLYLGLEKGLFPGDFIGTVRARGPDRITLIPTKETFGGEFSENKFRSLGARNGDLYGPAKQKGHVKLGLELRDVSRSIDEWEQLIERISQAASIRVWKNAPKNDSTEFIFMASVDFLDAVEVLQKERGIPKKVAENILSSSRTSRTPLLDFNQYKVIDWEKSSTPAIPLAVLSRLNSERAKYLDGLKFLSDEIMKAEKTAPVDITEIKMATDWWVLEWAKAAKPSEIYSSF